MWLWVSSGMMLTVRRALSSVIMALRMRVPTIIIPHSSQITISGSRPPQTTRPTSAGLSAAKPDGPP